MEATDEELMKLYAKGNEAAFAELYRRYEARLFGFFRRRLPVRQQNLSHDLFQTTWLKIHAARSKFDIKQKFSSWFFTIALNSLRDLLSAARWREDAVSENLDRFSEPQIKEDPLFQAELRELENALKLLPEQSREILLLSDWEGFASNEIGKMLSLGEDNVRQIISRSRKRIREARRAG